MHENISNIKIKLLLIMYFIQEVIKFNSIHFLFKSDFLIIQNKVIQIQNINILIN